MPERPQSDPPTDNLTTLGEAEGDAAVCRFEALRPRLQHGVTLTEAARATNVPVHEDENADSANASAVINALTPSISTGRGSTP